MKKVAVIGATGFVGAQCSIRISRKRICGGSIGKRCIKSENTGKCNCKKC